MPGFIRHNRLPLMLAVAGPLLLAATASWAADEDILLRIDGASGTRFAATCLLSAASGKESIGIDERTPFEATFEGSALNCEITAPSAIEVELRKGGSRSFGSTSRGTVSVNVGS